MAPNETMKKVQRKADEDLAPRKTRHGKQPHQKMKPYIVLQYLLKYTDENHTASAFDIIAFLEDCGINADRRSIYKDIDEINLVNWMLDNESDLEEAEETLAADEEGAEKLIVYDKKKKGFYVRQRRYDQNDIRLLAECVYSAKFLAEGQAKRLADIVCEFVSEYQAMTIKHDALLTDRVKTNNRSVINNIATINEAMSKELDGQRHTPEKISFKYLKSTINDVSQQVERRKGNRYVVSPYKLLINDGNYYLLAFDDKKQEMRTYRVDRMKGVDRTGEPREGLKEFMAIDLKSYTQRVFSMYSGNQQRVTLRFINPLLDTAIERFGTAAVFSKADDKHFTVEADVEISDQFFGWLLGFGNRVKLLKPQPLVDEFAAYIDKIRQMY